jgi:transposase-like protein
MVIGFEWCQKVSARQRFGQVAHVGHFRVVAKRAIDPELPNRERKIDMSTAMIYSTQDKIAALAPVYELLDAGHSENAACMKVAERGGPVAATLRKWLDQGIYRSSGSNGKPPADLVESSVDMTDTPVGSETVNESAVEAAKHIARLQEQNRDLRERLEIAEDLVRPLMRSYVGNTLRHGADAARIALA